MFLFPFKMSDGRGKCFFWEMFRWAMRREESGEQDMQKWSGRACAYCQKKKRCILIQRCMILIHSVSVQVFFQSHFYQSTGDKRNFGATCLAMFILHIQMVELDLREYLLLIRVDLKQLF